MRKTITNLLFALAAPALMGATPEAYRLFDNSGRPVSFDEMADSLSRADVVFIGENHNCPISHWMELEITKALHRTHGSSLTIGEEMMEADNQLLLDEYMGRAIEYDRFERDCGTTTRPTTTPSCSTPKKTAYHSWPQTSRGATPPW